MEIIENFLENTVIGKTIHLWLYLLLIPIILTLIIIFLFIIGFIDSNFLKIVSDLWEQFYITGQPFENIPKMIAWRIHLGILFILFIFFFLTQK